MTSEICVMNRLALVLAADSATTVTQWSDKGKEERYFKGANKIFQLSNHQPIGLMIFDSADILRVPWEIVVKDFRKILDRKTFNSVGGYASEFFDFLEGNQLLFPNNVQKDTLFSAVKSAAFKLVFSAGVEDSASPDEKRIAANIALNRRKDELLQNQFYESIGEDHFRASLAAWREEILLTLEEFRPSIGESYPDDLGLLVDVAMEDVYKHPHIHLGTTGLVFAGFGDHDIFPAMEEYQSCGLLAGKHLAFKKNEIAVTHETPAWIGAFAQTSMSDTFSLGLSEDVYSSMMQTLIELLPNFGEKICEKMGNSYASIPDAQQLVIEAARAIGASVLDRARQEHAYPLKRVLGVLPVDEMVELAETLINLQSLKEKVTKPSETVGGPVDVAVITRGEGLLWIRRKHFFDPALNSRYIQRQAGAYK